MTEGCGDVRHPHLVSAGSLDRISGLIQMEPAHIPQYASLFAIGVLAGPRRWIETMPTPRGLAWLAVGVGLAALAYLWAAFATVRGPDSGSWFICA